MRRAGYVAIVAILVGVTACGRPTSGVSCQDPPSGQTASRPDIILTVSPNPAKAGTEAQLSISGDALPSDALVGASLKWQCWDGTAWMDTHHMLRGTYGDYRTRALEPGVTVTWPAVGILLPNTSPVLIPDVPVGTYRIVDTVVINAEEVTVFVMVRVS